MNHVGDQRLLNAETGCKPQSKPWKQEMCQELCYNDELTLITIGHSLYKQVLFRLYLFWDVFPVILRTRGGPTLVMSYTSTCDPDCQVNC